MIGQLPYLVNASEEFERPGMTFEQGRYSGFNPLFSGNQEATLKSADWNWLTLNFTPTQSALQAGGTINTGQTFANLKVLGLMLPDMTQGSVLFAGVGGQVSQNNASLFWDNTNRILELTGAATGNVSQWWRVSGDTNNRLQATADGIMSWGPGNAAVDVSLTHIAGGTLALTTTGTTALLGVGVSSSFQSKGIDVVANFTGASTNEYAMYVQGTTTDTGSDHDYCVFAQMTANPASASALGPIAFGGVSQTQLSNSQNFTGEVIGGVFSARHYGTGTVAINEGVKVHTYSNATGTVTTLYGVKSQFGCFHDTAPYLSSNAVLGAGYGVYSFIVMDNGSTATTLHCFHSDPTAIATTGTITTVAGLFLDAITLTGGGTITNKYGVYQVGSGDQNYFNGPMGLGVLPTSGYQLQIKAGNANQILIDRASAGQTDIDIADNGTVKWQLVKTTTNLFGIFDSAVSKYCIQFQTGPKIGFLNTAPVALQTSAGDSTYSDSGATVVHSAGTFTGGTGSTAYTIGDIVKALKNYGLLTL